MVDCNRGTSNTKQAAWVALGSLFSFGFGIISSMILSRYFSKGDYGTYKQVLFIYNTLLVVFTLGLPKAYSYFLPRVNINQGKDVVNKITRLFLILGTIFSALLYILSNQIAQVLSNDDLAYALKVFSIVPILMLPTMGLESILATYKKARFMTAYVIVTRTAQLLFIVLPVILWNLNYVYALLGFDIACFVSFALALKLKNIPFLEVTKFEKSDIGYIEILKFSVPLMMASIWAIIAQSADQFFISHYFGKEVFAEFSNGWMELPFIGMITGACATVLSPVFSKLSSERVDPKVEIFPLWMRVFEKSALLIYPFLLYSCFFADYIMVFLYGNQYIDSDIFFIFKNLSCFFQIIIFAPLMINVGGMKYYSKIQFYTAIALLFFEYISVKTLPSPYLIGIISTICSIVRVFLMLIFVAKYFNIKIYQLFPINSILKIVSISIVILAGLRYLLSIYLDSYLLILIISFMLYCLLYIPLCHFCKINYISLLKN